MFQTTAILSAALLPAVLALDNGVGRLPAMGWNSWNAYYCDIDAAKIELAANGVVNEGFKAVGYHVLSFVDCRRTPTNNRADTSILISTTVGRTMTAATTPRTSSCLTTMRSQTASADSQTRSTPWG